MAQSILPLLAFLLFNDLVAIFYGISIFVGLLNIVIVFLIFNKIKLSSQSLHKWFDEAKELTGFGIQRVPGDIFYSLMIFLPAYFAGLFFSLELAGVISFALSLLTLFNLPATAISFVTLSHSASLLVNDKGRLRKETNYLLLFGIIYSSIAVIIAYFILDEFLYLFFDKEFIKYSSIINSILWALPMLTVFTILRSITDSAYKRPFNSYFIFVALSGFVLFAIFAVKFNNSNWLIYGNVLSYTLLALLSIIWIRKILYT